MIYIKVAPGIGAHLSHTDPWVVARQTKDVQITQFILSGNHLLLIPKGRMDRWVGFAVTVRVRIRTKVRGFVTMRASHYNPKLFTRKSSPILRFMHSSENWSRNIFAFLGNKIRLTCWSFVSADAALWQRRQPVQWLCPLSSRATRRRYLIVIS